MSASQESNSNNSLPAVTEFEWINLQKDINAEGLKHAETAKEKFQRKFNENPFVPIGCGLTAAALIYGLWNFRQGRSQMSQYMMRARVAAQGFTIVALLGGIAYAAVKEK